MRRHSYGLLFFEDTGRTSTIRYWYVKGGVTVAALAAV